MKKNTDLTAHKPEVLGKRCAARAAHAPLQSSLPLIHDPAGGIHAPTSDALRLDGINPLAALLGAWAIDWVALQTPVPESKRNWWQDRPHFVGARNPHHSQIL